MTKAHGAGLLLRVEPFAAHLADDPMRVRRAARTPFGTMLDAGLMPAPMPALRRTTMRKVADCRLMPSESACTLTIAGEQDEVLRAATEHAVSVHGHADSPELREQIRGMLADEEPAHA